MESDPNPSPKPSPNPTQVATSGEFCLAADGAPTDCESVQFISGVELQDAQTLLLAYGVNDCAAKVARLALERVWRMLRPLAAHAGDACYATSDIAAEGI